NALIMVVAFIGIFFAANYLAFQNPKSWDLTADKSNTLAPETLQTLETLPQKVKATAFYATLDSASADEVLAKFKTNSKGKFDYEFVNPDTDPLTAREAGITGDGKILLTMGGAKEVASYADEAEITKALIRLISPEKRAVYFLQGHGEAGFDSANLSYSVAKTTLESKNYTVDALNLLATKDIPQDASVIVIAGPQKPLTAGEVAQLKKYVDAGGSLFVMENPVLMTEFGTSPDPLANYLTSDWGITLNNDVVIDYVNTQNPLQAVSSNIGAHPITQNLTENYIVILPQARSVSIAGEKKDVTQTWLLQTTEQSWGETNLVQGENPQPDGADLLGPLNLAVAGENAATKGRVVVFGNSLFAVDDNFNVYGNGNIFVNSVDWAAEQENLINLTVRDQTQRTFIPPTQIVFIIIVIVAVFVLPGLVIFAGISSWLSRRRKG
ncbi:MAG: GldG family protein, partial [Anaerolineales bacterium]|nr:GldG family protein [Anaerolineales bacterium]